jgi:hypothetical protein
MSDDDSIQAIWLNFQLPTISPTTASCILLLFNKKKMIQNLPYYSKETKIRLFEGVNKVKQTDTCVSIPYSSKKWDEKNSKISQ